MKNLKNLTLIVFVIIVCFLFSACSTNNNGLTTVRLNEVTHSIFYAPQYVAIEKGFFEQEGLRVEISPGQGADKSMTALISKSADVALLGTEAGIYVYNEGKEDYAIAFAQLTQRAGNFLVSRENNQNFSWQDVKGKQIIGGRNGGMPQMVLEYILKSNNIDITKDVEIITNLEFTTTSGAYASGIGDYTVEFEPSAYNLEKENKGYVVASLGVDSGKVPYTVYMSTKSYINENPEILQKFTNAIYKAQMWVDENTSKEIAEVIAPQFKENSLEEIEAIVERYKSQDTWKTTPVFDKDAFELIQDIMESSGELSKRVNYDDMINTDFAENTIKTVK